MVFAVTDAEVRKEEHCVQKRCKGFQLIPLAGFQVHWGFSEIIRKSLKQSVILTDTNIFS